MDLGLNLAMSHWDTGPQPNLGLAQEAEALGFSSIWIEEAYGSDAVSTLAWVGALTSRIALGSAVWQMSARTPAMTAMTAATVDKLSGGRLRLGLGASGPQVVEGWHGQPFNGLLGRTREYVEVVRKILAREGSVANEGKYYPLPYPGDEGLSLGRPLKLILHPLRADVPIYIGSLGPRNVELTAEIADGWLPIFFSPSVYDEVFAEPLANGFAKAGGGKGPGNGFDVSPVVSVVLDDDVDAARLVVKQRIALYIGGMGHAKANFSNQLIRRFGFEAEAEEIQSLFLSDQRERAVAAVPDALIDEIALCGPKERIDELLDKWRRSPVTTLVLDTDDVAAMRVMSELLGSDQETVQTQEEKT